MKTTCEKCGAVIEVNSGGRKSLAMPLTMVYEALQTHTTVTDAAEKLGCSPAYIFKVLKANGKTAKELLKQGKRVSKKSKIYDRPRDFKGVS